MRYPDPTTLISPRRFLSVTTAVCLVLGACSSPENPDRPDPRMFDGQKALEETINFIKISPRTSGTENAKKATAYIVDRLSALKLKPDVCEFEDTSPEGRITFRNVTATIPSDKGADRIILISHYDTKAGLGENFKGANDSGSSTGILLELARTLTASPKLPLEIMLAFVDGEECVRRYGPEDGLHGSRRLLQNIQDGRQTEMIKAVIVIDMVGDKNLSITIPRNCSAKLKSLVLKAATDEKVRNLFSLMQTDMVDDHLPFHESGIPTVNVIDFLYGSRPGLNDYWHTGEDTADKLSAGSMQTVGRVIIRIINELSGLQPR